MAGMMGERKKPVARPEITLREVAAGEFELVYPPCVGRRKEDMAEVRAMLKAGEVDVAVDELRWLLEDCRPLVEAHQLLGQIAFDAREVELARGHFAAAYALGQAAAAKGPPGLRLPYRRPANRPLLKAAKGLAMALAQSGDKKGAADVVRSLLAWDPGDPLDSAEVGLS